MGYLFVLLLLFGFSCSENSPSLQGPLNAQDRERLVNLLQNTRVDTLETAFYVSRGLGILGASENVRKGVCNFVKQNVPASSSLDSVFYATAADSALSCKTSFKGLQEDLRNSLASDHNITELYYIASSLANLGNKADEKTLPVSRIVEMAEQEESITSYGRAFLIGAQLKDGDVGPLMDMVEDVTAQADETPTALYFEGGLVPVATVISGIFELGERAGKRPTLSTVQATLFGNYILSIRHTESSSEAYYLLSAAQALSSNKFTTPIGLTRVNKKQLSSDNKNFEVRLVNALGNGVGKNTVTLVSTTGPKGTDTPINKPFKADKDGVTYSYQLYDAIKTQGTYTVTLGTQPAGTDSTVPSLVDIQMSVIVGFSVTVLSAEISVLEKDQNVAVVTSALQYPSTSKESFTADHHSKVKMNFKLSTAGSKDTVTVHQTFVQLVSSEGEDIYFVATPTNGVYTFELDVAESAKEYFGSKSGTYKMSLIVGGASVINPFSWEVASLVLKFPDVPSEDVSEEIEYRYKPKPIIEHMFQVPEKRPPTVISMTFSVLVMVPLIILIPVWLILGANFSKFGVSGPWALIFHIGLAAIFMLYYCFWTNLNMFQTLKYLSIIGVVTFMAGNRMLKRIAKTH